MPTDFAPAATPLGATVELPADGDKRKAASVNVALEALSNGLRHIQHIVARASAPGGASPQSRSYGEGIPLENCVLQAGLGRIANNTTAANISERASILYEIFPPDGATLNGVAMWLDGAGSTLPAVMASFVVYEVNHLTGSLTTIGSVTDTAASGAAFGARHAIILNGLSHVVDRAAKSYFVQYEGHHNNGGGALASGSNIWRPNVTFTAPQIDKGAG